MLVCAEKEAEAAVSASIKFALEKAEAEWQSHFKSVKAELSEFQRFVWTLEEEKELERVRASRLEHALEAKEMEIEMLQEQQQSRSVQMNGKNHGPAEEFVAIDKKAAAEQQSVSWFSFCAGGRK